MTRIETLRSTFWIWAGLIIALLATQVAGAAEIRTIASTGEASSECIGDPRTPLCALDTWEACFVWRQPSLCKLVGLDGKEFRGGEGEGEGEDASWVYTYQPYDMLEIEDRHLADIENRLVRLPPDQTWFRPGYVDLRFAVCYDVGPDECATHGVGVAIILKPVGKMWHVSGWHAEFACEAYDPPNGYYPASLRECNLLIAWRDFNDYEISRDAAERRKAKSDLLGR